MSPSFLIVVISHPCNTIGNLCTIILQEVLLGLLNSKTVLYVTHQVEFLPAADLVLVSNISIISFYVGMCFPTSLTRNSPYILYFR